MKTTYDSASPKTEFSTRITRLKEFATAQNLAALTVFSASRSHIWYQTGHVSYISNWSDRDRIFDTMAVVPTQGDPVLLMAGLPYVAERARQISWIDDVRVVTAPDPRAAVQPGLVRTFGTEVRQILRERNLEGRKIGLLGVETMAVPLYECLIDALSASTIEIPDDVVADLRCRKSNSEIALMKKAAQLSDLAYETLVEVAKPGMMGYEVIAEMERAVRNQAADFAQFWMASGPSDGSAMPQPDMRPHRRELQTADMITCCSYVIFEGYWAHAMRTGTVGAPSHRQQQIFDPCLDVHRSTIAAMKPGVAISKIVHACRNAVEAAGMTLYSLRIGHGIGLDYGEKPFISDINTETLAPGMTVEIHAQVSVPGIDGFFVPLGDLCHVTDDGVELLTKFPQGLFKI